MDSRGSPNPGVTLRLTTHPHSVPTARRVVADTLRGWGLEVLVDDAILILTELCTNATLHSGASYFRVSVRATPREVHLAVGDDGPVPAAAVVRRDATLRADLPEVRGLEAATGRGLAIIDEVADTWGVDTDEGEKWVWASLSSEPRSAAGSPPESDLGRAAEATPAPRPADVDVAKRQPLPPGWHLVRLDGCPVQLSLAQDDHLDELVRELQLVTPSGDQSRLAAVIRDLLDGQASARHMGRRTAQEAAAAGLEHVTIEMLLPDRAADEVERLHDAVAAADALCDSDELLTLASAPDVRTLRTWMRDQIRNQIKAHEAPQSYARWLSDAAPA